jgi:ribonuclease BN (tRNA processing enzyme)
MRLTVVGTHGMVGVPDEANPGYLLTSEGQHLLMDCGPGVAPALRRYLRPAELAGVVISHMHIDDYYDLLPLALGIYIDGRDVLSGGKTQARAPLPVFLPPGGSEQLHDIVRAVAGGREGSMRLFNDRLDCRDFAPNEPFAIGPFTVEPFLVEHTPGPCFGFRVATERAVIGYSGDSAMCDALAKIARESDLFLCEASIITEKVRSVQAARHLSADGAGRIAKRAGTKHLVLTHLLHTSDGWYDALTWAARQYYRGPVSIARAGSVFEVPYE